MSKKLKKIWLTVSIIISSIFVVVFGVGWYLIYEIEKKATNLLITQIEDATNGLYHLDIEDFKIKFRHETVSLKNIHIYCDSLLLKEYISKNNTPSYVYNIGIEEINIRFLDIIKTYLDKDFTIEEFLIKSPSIQVFKQNADSLNNNSISTHKKEYNTALNFISFFITGANIYYYDKIDNKDSLLYTLENTSVRINNIIIDTSFNLKEDIKKTKEFKILIGGFKHKFENYELRLKNIFINVKDSSLHIDTLGTFPLYKKYEFALRTGISNRIEFLCKNITFKKIDINSLINGKLFKTDSIYIGNMLVKSFQNKNVNSPKTEKLLYHHYLQRLPYKIDVSKVEIADANIIYEELPAGQTKSGYVQFKNINANISSFTNIVREESPYLKLEAVATFMKSGKLSFILSLPIDSLNENFTAEGSLRGFKMNEINKILEPIAHANMESGIVNELSFNISGNNTNLEANILMLYNDFSISILTSDNISKRRLLSELANDLILIKDNPYGDEKERSIIITSERNVNTSHLNFMWNSLFLGIKESIGLTKEIEQKLNEIKEKINFKKNTKSTYIKKEQARYKNKKEREERKKKRKERKEKRREVFKNL